MRVGAHGGRVVGAPLCNIRRGDIDVSTVEDDKAHLGDYVAVLEAIEKIPTAVLAKVVSLWAPHGANASTSSLTPLELADAKSAAHVRPLVATARGAVLYSSGASSHKQLEVAGSVVLPLTLHAETNAVDGVIKPAADLPS